MIAREPTICSPSADAQPPARCGRGSAACWTGACSGGGSSIAPVRRGPCSSSARSTAAHGCEPWTTYRVGSPRRPRQHHTAAAMLLVVDVGNTQTHFGTFDGDELVEHWRFATVRESTADELGAALREPARAARPGLRRPRRLDRLLDGPAARRPSGRRWRALPRPRDARRRPGHADGHADPLRQPARDRRRPPRQRRRRLRARSAAPCIVVDFGTAITYDAVSAEGEYLGGIIAPGVEISMEALTERAAEAAARSTSPRRAR